MTRPHSGNIYGFILSLTELNTFFNNTSRGAVNTAGNHTWQSVRSHGPNDSYGLWIGSREPLTNMTPHRQQIEWGFVDTGARVAFQGNWQIRPAAWVRR
jgi:hypothetical protein